MAVIGTFSQFTTARLAIYASQASLSVTGNNISNINTAGYTRQRMDLVSLYSTGQGKYANIFNTNVGYGVLTNGATQLRDIYLDIRYRNENTKLSANDEKLDGLYQIGNILDEVGKGTGQLEGFGVIEAQFGVFYEMLNKGDLTHYGSEEYDDLVRSAASTLAAYFRKAAADLEEIKSNKVNELNESISEVNKLLTLIRDLNVQIRTAGIYGDKALELRDARNLAIDQLSSYIPIDVTYSMERIDQFTEVEKLTITIKNSQGPDGQPIKLVDGIYGGQLTMQGKVPEINENYDYKKFIDAVNAAKEAAQEKELWTDGAKDNGYGYGDIDPSVWANDIWKNYPFADSPYADLAALRKAVEDAMAAAKTKTEAKYEDTDATDEEIAAAVAAAQKKAAERILRPALTTAYVANAEDQQLKAGNGKYVLLNQNTGAIDGYTNSYEDATKDPYGYFNYDDHDMLREDSLYMLRVEQLVDQRGRVMDDFNDPTTKSQAIALDDTTFCTQTVDTSADLTRVDSNALGALQAIREMLTRKGEYSTQEDIDRDNYATIKRGIPYYERALDSLAKRFADILNQINQLPLETVYGPTVEAGGPIKLDPDDPNSEQLVYKRADGTEIKLNWNMLVEEVPVLDYNGNQVYKTDDNGDFVLDANGDKIPLMQYQFRSSVGPNDAKPPEDATELKAMIEQVRAQVAKQPGYSYYKGGVLISNRGDNNDPSNITAANISVSYSWSNHTVRILNTRQKMQVDGNGNETSHSTLRDNIGHMVSLFDTKWDYFAQDVKKDAAATLPVFHGSFREVFTAIGSTLAEDYNATAGKVENYTISTLNLENDRLSVSGVDLNEEATSMMQFSKSYAAACRLLTTIDSMLDTLINGTAR